MFNFQYKIDAQVKEDSTLFRLIFTIFKIYRLELFQFSYTAETIIKTSKSLLFLKYL